MSAESRFRGDAMGRARSRSSLLERFSHLYSEPIAAVADVVRAFRRAE
jgi:hypothetical protein